MKQVLQNLRNGDTSVVDVPCPAVRSGQVLIRTRMSLISPGTERMLLNFGSASLLEKARQQPDKVRAALDKVRVDGLLPTLDALRDKLDRLMPLGYSNVGVVLEAGPGVSGFQVGERVVSNGPHAEVVSASPNLCAKVPEGVSDEAAAFAVLGAVALQGIRLARPTLGEAFVVTGLGLVGLLAVQFLRAHGCRVLGLDPSPQRTGLARRFGAQTVELSAGEDPMATAMQFSRGRGVDGVIIAASTDSNEPIRQAAQMCRKRGRIVLVGAAGMRLSRSDFYEKELTFQVSCSYGPGRHDPEYEQKGRDYPFGFVRWTEQRNFEAVLDMMRDARLDVEPLVSHRFPVTDAETAYELIGSSAPSLGILLLYALAGTAAEAGLRETTLQIAPHRLRSGAAGEGRNRTVAGFVGAGNYATSVLIPAFKAANAHLKVVASGGGASGLHAGRKFGFEETTTDNDRVFTDPQVNAIVIATRHDSHATLTCRSLRTGKHVFVEKPLALTLRELDEIERAHAEAPPDIVLMVGFNRRFAPHVQRMKALLAAVSQPKVFVMTVNAGILPHGHWARDPEVGGGRILGEACHFLDLLRFLAGCAVDRMQVASVDDSIPLAGDNSSITLQFADGSLGIVLYLASGHRSFPKERLEVFAGGRVLQLDNFRKLVGFGWPGFSGMKTWRQDKGQRACVQAFVTSVEQHGTAPIPLSELIEVSRLSIEAARLLRR